MDVVYQQCCGLDVHKKSVVACLLTSPSVGEVVRTVRTFGTMTEDLLALSDWLAGANCTHVAMESTRSHRLQRVHTTHAESDDVDALAVRRVGGRQRVTEDPSVVEVFRCDHALVAIEMRVVGEEFERAHVPVVVAGEARAVFVEERSQSHDVGEQHQANRCIGYFGEFRLRARRQRDPHGCILAHNATTGPSTPPQRVWVAIRTWPEGRICSGCFARACETYGACPGCGIHRLLPGRLTNGDGEQQPCCSDCAPGIGDFTCTRCGQ